MDTVAISDTRSLTEVLTCIIQRVGIDHNHLPQILVCLDFKIKYYVPTVGLICSFISLMQASQILLQYEDEDHDKVILASDSDLVAAVDHARMVGLKVCYQLLCSVMRKLL